MGLNNAKSFIPSVAQRAKSAVSNVVKAAREVSDNVTQPRKAKQYDADRASIKLARETKGMSFATAANNGMYDVANAKTSAARIKRQVAKRRKAK